MKGLTLTTKEQTRLQVLNGVLARLWPAAQGAEILGVSERHVWRLLAAYRKEGAAALSHGNRGRMPPNATSVKLRALVVSLAREGYQGVNHTHLTELLAEREGVKLSRSRRMRFSRRSRRKHIARGNGTAPADVNRLLNQFQQMKKMLKKFSGEGRNAPRLPRGLLGMFR